MRKPNIEDIKEIVSTMVLFSAWMAVIMFLWIITPA